MASRISDISIKYFKGTHIVVLSLFQTKLAEKKHVSLKSTFYYIVMLAFKLEIVKDIFENEKLNLNLNSMRFKKKQRSRK